MGTRIAFVDHTAVLSGGEVALANLIDSIDRTHWSPELLIGAHGPLGDRVSSSGVPISVVHFPKVLAGLRQERIGISSFVHPARAAAGFSYLARLAVTLRRKRVALVHANTLKASILGGLAARMVGIPNIWQIHSVVSSRLMSPTGLRLVRTLARRVPDHIICNSKTTAADFDIPLERISVVPCGVDSTRFIPDGRILTGAPRIGMIARFAPLKGQHVFIDAAARLANRHPGAEFVLAGTALFGEESYERQVREAAAVLDGKAAVRILGFVEDVPALLRELDIVVNPSVVPEGFGQTIVEAMMAEKPVVASASGGPVDVLDDRVTGRLVPPGDPQALADALDELLSDRPAAVAMGQRARQRAVERYDLRRTTRSIEEIYERVLARA